MERREIINVANYLLHPMYWKFKRGDIEPDKFILIPKRINEYKLHKALGNENSEIILKAIDICEFGFSTLGYYLPYEIELPISDSYIKNLNFSTPAVEFYTALYDLYKMIDHE